ncbi:hypothetical protein DACRYDRAFT_24941 [Dacryopinax primogenitus]|uniref:Ubiquinone biosynthesis protein n=1 Tax=Dacryopinax primogenitus (strain DJM 731) TaxID=1858805 RepID=M5FNJ1_DACPD|nr:uncharacterized protein DACRYDRAFT_24941 [Dacryopinax primogenitus]EJT97535.1 hypothetical protein DACRYDRAFT_24941 [Dacryopinax primogenitus]
MSRAALLQRALTFVPSHGFTRSALTLSSVDGQPLSDTAVTALFGRGDEAERTLFRAWLEEGKKDMREGLSESGNSTVVAQGNGDKEKLYALLARRLRWNEPVLDYLPDAFALLSSPSLDPPFSLPLPLSITLPRLRLIPGLAHVSAVADEACWLLSEPNDPPGAGKYYAQRARIGTIYALSELHQLSSPSPSSRTDHFLRDMLNFTGTLPQVAGEVGTFLKFVGRSWAGILRSRGM